MSDKTFYGRLQRLFNTNVVIRTVGKNKLRVVDNDHLQSVGNAHNSKFIDRFTRLHGVRPSSFSTYNPNYNYFSSKTELYTDYEVMDQDSILASALDIYSDECVMKDDFGDVLRITSDNENIKRILHNLFYDILNIEFNLWPWVRNMCKYGDLYLKLDIQEGIGIINVTPLSAYEIVREEGMDLQNPYHVQFKLLGGGNITYENFEIAHFRLLNDSNFLPYGKSILEPARKVWKQLTLMEDAMLIHRIMRAPEKRIFKIDVGNIPAGEVDNHMQRIMNQMRKTPYVDPQTGEYNLKFNMMNMLEDYFLPVRGGQSGTEIDTLSGMEFTGIDDIEYLRNKMMSALKVPKAFLGYDEAISGKATLAAEDVRFARTIERIQRIVISELHKIAIIHLYSQGFENAELINFELDMTSPSTIYEQEKLTLYGTKVDLAKSMIEGKILPKDWIYRNLFNFTPDEIAVINEEIVSDQKEAFRLTKISDEGEDPADPRNQEPKKEEGEEGGGDDGSGGGGNPFETEEEGGEEKAGAEAAGDEAKPVKDSVDLELQKKYDSEAKKKRTPKGGWPGAGRPKEGMKYNTHNHPRGYDPLGQVAWKNARTGKLRSESTNILDKYGLTKFVKNRKVISETFLDESNIIQ
jgi:hypothetical protein